MLNIPFTLSSCLQLVNVTRDYQIVASFPDRAVKR